MLTDPYYDDELCEKDQLEATDLGAEPDVSFESAYPSGGRSRLQLTPAHYHPHEPLRPRHSPYPLPSHEWSHGMHPAPPRPYSDRMIQSLLQSQKQMMGMFEKVSERIGNLEKAVTSIKSGMSSSPASSSPEDKKRIPPQLSVSHAND